MSHYETLGVSQKASDADIKKAYRTLSLKYHPDRNNSSEAEDKIRDINKSYETLGDASKRKQYNMELQFGDNPFAQLSSGNMPFMKTSTMNSSADMEDINELLGALFGGGISPNIHIFQEGLGSMGMGGMRGMRGIGSKIVRKPDLITKTITISMKQAYTGCNLPIVISRHITTASNAIEIEDETLYVNIYQGIDHNETILIPEKGHVTNSYVKGDVKICINIDNTSIFERQGLDLILYKTITLKESLCGFSFKITHLHGKELLFNNNTNNTIVKPNFKKTIANMGFIREQTNGNLIIIFDIVFPDTLESSQIEALNKLL
jgi:DnaJ-class molecular chaperone